MKLRTISLGAGVQSTTLALMAAAGELTPMPDCAVFADTQWEPKAVYEHLDRLEKALPFPVYRVTAGDIRDNIIRDKNTTGQRFAAIPWHLASGGMGRRQCTKEFKIAPLRRKLRDLLGYLPGKPIRVPSVEVWIGISVDEAVRMKPSLDRWIVNRWPLIERGMSRWDCRQWLAKRGWSAPKSACIGCPFRSDEQWRDLKDNAPADFADAIEVDRLLRAGVAGAARGMRHQLYMHRARVPLAQVDLSSPAEWGQLDLWPNECEGMCGV